MSEAQLLWDAIDMRSEVKRLSLPFKVEDVRFCLSDPSIPESHVADINELVTAMTLNPNDMTILREVFGTTMPTWDEVIELIKQSLMAKGMGFQIYTYHIESEDRALIIGFKGALDQAWQKLLSKKAKSGNLDQKRFQG